MKRGLRINLSIICLGWRMMLCIELGEKSEIDDAFLDEDIRSLLHI